MTDIYNPRQNKLGNQSLDLDEFLDVENEMVWRREDLRTLGFLLGDLAIIVAIITVGMLLG